MLNEQQKRLVDENEKLIYGFAHQYNVKLDDFYDVLAIGLCKAGMTYNKEKGMFSTYAYKVMLNEYLTELDKENAIKRKGETIEYMESTHSTYNKTHLDTDIVVLDYLNETEKQLLRLKLQGYTYREIADIMGFKYPMKVCRILDKTKQKMRSAGF